MTVDKCKYFFKFSAPALDIINVVATSWANEVPSEEELYQEGTMDQSCSDDENKDDQDDSSNSGGRGLLSNVKNLINRKLEKRMTAVSSNVLGELLAPSSALVEASSKHASEHSARVIVRNIVEMCRPLSTHSLLMISLRTSILYVSSKNHAFD
jgi:hypothetical protein